MLPDRVPNPGPLTYESGALPYTHERYLLYQSAVCQFAEKGHRTGRTATHQCCWGGTWYVILEDQEMKDKLGK